MPTGQGRWRRRRGRLRRHRRRIASDRNIREQKHPESAAGPTPHKARPPQPRQIPPNHPDHNHSRGNPVRTNRKPHPPNKNPTHAEPRTHPHPNKPSTLERDKLCVVSALCRGLSLLGPWRVVVAGVVAGAALILRALGACAGGRGGCYRNRRASAAQFAGAAFVV